MDATLILAVVTVEDLAIGVTVLIGVAMAALYARALYLMRDRRKP